MSNRKKFQKYLFNYFLIYLITFYQNCRADENERPGESVHKCCVSGLVLQTKVGVNGVTWYECHQPAINASLFGYNLEINSEVNIPTCENIALVEFTNEGGVISANGCIDSLEDHVYGLNCPVSEHSLNVHRLNKCCPEGFSYDLNERYCVENANYMTNFHKYFGNAIVLFKQKVPKCNEDDEVFVEYHSHTHNIELTTGGLNIALDQNEKDFLSPQAFCVDGAVRVNPVNDEIFVAGDPNELIVRSCRPRTICNRMPCVRRCCENEQMMERQNGTTVCVAHPENKNLKPIFHKIDFPIQTLPQNQINPAGMLKCYFFLSSVEK